MKDDARKGEDGYCSEERWWIVLKKAQVALERA